MSESLGIDKQVQNLFAGVGGKKTEEILKHYNGKFSCLDMFTHLWNLEEAHSNLTIEIPNSRKSKNESENFRNQGNKAFQKKRLCEALKLYNRSILVAPHPPLEDGIDMNGQISNKDSSSADEEDVSALPLAFANRSAVLFELKQYHDCLNDIERALRYGYPESLQHKLTKRKESCNTALEDPEAQASRLVTHYSVIPPVVAEPNPNIPGLSNAVKVAFGPTVGRYLVAQREILPGEILAVEEIYSRCLYRQHMTDYCSNCFSRCLIPLPCPTCKEVIYCSNECRRKGLSGQHGLECKIFPALVAMNSCMLIPFRILTKNSFSYLKKILPQLRSIKESGSPMSLGFNEKGVYDPKDYRTISCLVSNKEKRDDRSLFTICAGAFMLTKLLQKCNFFVEDDNTNICIEPSKEDLMEIGSALFHHIMSDLSNGHRYGELQAIGSDKHPDIENIGSWVSATLSLANHSCDQAVTTCNKGNLAVMTAIQVIRQGQEVTTGYLKGYGVQNVALRREILSDHYLFQCNCQPCKENWPTFGNLPDNYQLKCLECSNFINRSDHKCSSCGLEYTMDALAMHSWKRIDETVGLGILKFLRMRRDFNANSFELNQDALQITLRAIDVMDRHVMLPNKIYANAKGFLAGLLSNQRDYVIVREGF